MESGVVEASMNVFDLGVLGIVGLSALLAFFRGFVREVLSLGAWVGAALITLYWFPDIADWLEPQVGDAAVAAGLAAMGTFMGSLVIITIINSMFIKFMKSGSEIGLLDNGMGLVFGVLRGTLVVAVAYFIMSVVIPDPNDRPKWINEAKTRPYVEEAAVYVSKIAPEYMKKLSPLKDEEPKPILERVMGDGTRDIDDDSGGSRWESMEELQDRMRNN